LVPCANVEPLGGSNAKLTPGQSLLTVAAYVTLLAVHWPGSVEVTISAEHSIVPTTNSASDTPAARRTIRANRCDSGMATESRRRC